jgi:glycosyltransferase involved in cell wall biosynthesis
LPAKIYINGRFLQQPLTGVQRYSRELLKAWDDLLVAGELDPNGTEFVVLAPNGPIEAPRYKHISFRQVGRFHGHLWDQCELPFWARDGLLFSPGNVHPLVSPFLCPGVVAIHDLSYRTHPDAYTSAFRCVYRLLIPAAISRAKAIVTVSEAEKRNIINHFPDIRARIYAVHHGAPAIDVLATDSCPSDQANDRTREIPDSYALWVGTLFPRKNPQGAIDAISLLNQDKSLDLVVAGAAQHGLVDNGLRIPSQMEQRIHFIGQLNNSTELARLYRGAKALLFPSFYESFGLPALEAMTFGCPVVASDIPALREVCSDAAVYCDPNAPYDIAEKLRMVIEDASLREQMRNRGAVRAKQFSWKKCALETFAILNGVIEPTKSGLRRSIQQAGRSKTSKTTSSSLV